MNNVECPHCNTLHYVERSDGEGTEEDVLYEKECSNCGNIFGFYTTIQFGYNSVSLPCKNGEDHTLYDIVGLPSELFAGKKRCKHCRKTFIVDQEKYDKSIKKYMLSLQQPCKVDLIKPVSPFH